MAMKCPTCKIPLCRIDYEGLPVHTCPDCGGTLVPAPRLASIQDRRVIEWTDERRREAVAEANLADRPEPIRCPLCSLRMGKRLIAFGKAGLRLDVCDDCEATWFDRGELELAQVFQEDHEDTLDPDLRARRAAALLQFEEQVRHDRREFHQTLGNLIPKQVDVSFTAGDMARAALSVVDALRRRGAADLVPSPQLQAAPPSGRHRPPSPFAAPSLRAEPPARRRERSPRRVVPRRDSKPLPGLEGHEKREQWMLGVGLVLLLAFLVLLLVYYL